MSPHAGAVTPFGKHSEAALFTGAGYRVVNIDTNSSGAQEWSDSVGADCYGENAAAALNKVKMIRAGEVTKLRGKRKAKL